MAILKKSKHFPREYLVYENDRIVATINKHKGFWLTHLVGGSDHGRICKNRYFKDAKSVAFGYAEDRDDYQAEIPEDFPVRPLADEEEATDKATCGTCGRSWDDAIVTSYTPAPSARCPFEYFHDGKAK